MSVPKVHRTPRQIAQDQLDLTERKLVRNKAAQANLRARLAEAEALGADLERLATYQRSHPALADSDSPTA